MKKQRTLDIIQLFKDYKSIKDEKKKKKDEECEALMRSFLSRLKRH